MKKAFILPLLFFSLSGYATGNLSALFSYCTFNVTGDTPYLETYLHVIGNTVKLVPAENNLVKGQIEVLWTIKKGDSVIYVDKYNLNSPPQPISDSFTPDFIDQQRVKLAMGIYNVNLSIKDKNSEAKPISIGQYVTIDYPQDSISISDIELLESYSKADAPGERTKSGYNLVPSVSSFYPSQNSALKFYAEIYNSNKIPAEEFLVRYYISKYDNNEILSSYSFNRRQQPEATSVLLAEIPINDLQSGNYYLNIEARNKKNERLALKQIMFQRSNPQTKNQVVNDVSMVNVSNTFIWNVTDIDSLTGLIDCLHPIASNVEIDVSDQLMQMKDPVLMQKFIYYFWHSRDPQNPEAAWKAYMVEVDKVNKLYTAMGIKGYATDRGRVHLQYGPPNIISNGAQDPSAYPYEIWQYYKLKDQSNRKFVFYSQEAATNNYELLHSDARGELQQPQWQAMLHERIPTHKTQNGAIGIDQNESNDFYGSYSKEKFANPR